MSPQDTPGRPKSSASRQQTQPDQGTQSGSPQVDAKDTGSEKAKRKYRNGPADAPKHEDATQRSKHGQGK